MFFVFMCESLVTLIAYRTFVCCLLTCESLVAYGTFIWLFAAVRSQVHHKVPGYRELLPALWTNMFPSWKQNTHDSDAWGMPEEKHSKTSW